MRTSRILLGTSISSVFVRTAPTIAMAASKSFARPKYCRPPPGALPVRDQLALGAGERQAHLHGAKFPRRDADLGAGLLASSRAPVQGGEREVAVGGRRSGPLSLAEIERLAQAHLGCGLVERVGLRGDLAR